MQEKGRIPPAIIIPVGLGLGLVAAVGIAALAWAAPLVPKGYSCPYCPDIFDTYEELQAHIQSVHAGERIPSPLALAKIAILGVNGKSFIDIGIDADGLPYGELAEPIVASSLIGATITWRNGTAYFTEDDIIGLVVPMWYEPAWAAEPPCNAPPSWIGYNRVDLECTNPEGCPPGIRNRTGIFEDIVEINTLFGHGYYCEGIYNARFKADYNTPGGPYPSGMEFRIKNMVRCTGEGMK